MGLMEVLVVLVAAVAATVVSEPKGTSEDEEHLGDLECLMSGLKPPFGKATECLQRLI
jgi:hypothetical protein